MPDGCRTIEKEAFSGQNTIARIIIPEGVTTLESCAISNCDALETIEIPSTVTYIDRGWTDYGNSFCYCKKLTSINVSEDNKHYSSADGILFDKQITIPLNVISIGTNAFGGSNLTINCEVEESNIPTGWSNNWYGSAKSVNYGVKK